MRYHKECTLEIIDVLYMKFNFMFYKSVIERHILFKINTAIFSYPFIPIKNKYYSKQDINNLTPVEKFSIMQCIEYLVIDFILFTFEDMR